MMEKDLLLKLRRMLAEAGREFTPAHVEEVTTAIEVLFEIVNADIYNRFLNMTSSDLITFTGKVSKVIGKCMLVIEAVEFRNMVLYVYEKKIGLPNPKWDHDFFLDS